MLKYISRLIDWIRSLSSKELTVNVTLSNTACIPYKSRDQDAGWDLYALCDDGFIVIPPHGVHKVPTGISLEIPVGWFGYIITRSSTCMRQMDIAGVIDAPYRGDIVIVVRNMTDSPMTISHGERIAQIVFLPVPKVRIKVVDRLSESTRGVKGFGSSGTH